MKRRLIVAVGANLVVLLGLGCDPSATGNRDLGPRSLVVTGSSTVAPLFNEIARRFESQHPGVRVDVQTGGSSRGVADVRRGVADIGMVSRALVDSEGDLVAHTIAQDGLCMIVNARNSIRALSDDQVRQVYLGRVRNWRELGGEEAPIVVVNKAEGRATLELFLAHFGLRNMDIRADVVIGDNEQGVKTVAGNPHAIAYVSVGAAEYQERAAVPIRRLAGGNGVEATLANVANGTFPIRRPLNLVTMRRAPEAASELLVAELIRFARSAAVRDLVEGLYLVPIEP
ncbi:MAG: phosphate ABC transporter substrate-binding protein [Planctomycetota bacterium]